jgi:dodecin
MGPLTCDCPAAAPQSGRGHTMTVAKISEITSTSTKSFDDAIHTGIKRATKRLKNVTSAWVQDQEVAVKNNKVSEYRVRLRITFVLNN